MNFIRSAANIGRLRHNRNRSFRSMNKTDVSKANWFLQVSQTS